MGDASPLKQIDRQRVAQLFRIAEVEIADSNPLIGSYISLVGNGVGTELEGVFQMAGIGIFSWPCIGGWSTPEKGWSEKYSQHALLRLICG